MQVFLVKRPSTGNSVTQVPFFRGCALFQIFGVLSVQLICGERERIADGETETVWEFLPGQDWMGAPVTSVYISLTRTKSQATSNCQGSCKMWASCDPQEEKGKTNNHEHQQFLPSHSVLSSDLACSRPDSRALLIQGFFCAPSSLVFYLPTLGFAPYSNTLVTHL